MASQQLSTAALFVGNLSYTTTEEALYTFFGRMGTVVNVRFLMHAATSRPKGGCVVTFAEEAHATFALNSFQGAVFDGRQLFLRPFYAQGPPPRNAATAKPREATCHETSFDRCDASVFVGNLNYATTEKSIDAFFNPMGEIRRVHLLKFSDTRRPKGVCVVTFATAMAAENAVRSLQGALLDGRPLFLRPFYAKPPPREASCDSIKPEGTEVVNNQNQNAVCIEELVERVAAIRLEETRTPSRTPSLRHCC